MAGGDPRRQKVLIGVLVALASLALVVVQGWRREEPPAAAAAAPARATAAAPLTRGGTQQPPEVPAVRLGALKAARTDLEEAERNPFRFKPKPPPPPPPAPKPVAPRPVDPNAPPPPPPAPPPIPLKFIGVVEAPGQGGKVAVLSDGRNVFYGREGDIIEGRYRVLRIGAESAELTYVDGRGRQVIRLSGQ